MLWKSTVVTTLILPIILLGGGQSTDPDVLMESFFPPARPSVNNLRAVCHYGIGRPRYVASSFPSSSYSYARRAGKAINRLEWWFSQCCYGGVAYGTGQILCCAQQAWETALSYFCTEEYATMTLVHKCCEKMGEERRSCFDQQAPKPSYHPLSGYTAPIIPADTIFIWDPNTC